MLYTNKDLRVNEREMSFGKLRGVTIGECGRGRKDVFIPVPEGIDEIRREVIHELSIGLTKSGRPKIIKGTDGKHYLILSSQANYTRRGDGVVRYLKAQGAPVVIDRGNGADGAAGRIGTWDVVIVEANEGDIFRVTWSGYNYGIDPTYYVVHNGSIFSARQPDVEILFGIINVDIPFTLKNTAEGFVITRDEWEEI